MKVCECGNYKKWKTSLEKNCIQCLICYTKYTVKKFKKLKDKYVQVSG